MLPKESFTLVLWELAILTEMFFLTLMLYIIKHYSRVIKSSWSFVGYFHKSNLHAVSKCFYLMQTCICAGLKQVKINVVKFFVCKWHLLYKMGTVRTTYEVCINVCSILFFLMVYISDPDQMGHHLLVMVS